MWRRKVWRQILSPHPHVADTQANNEDETEQSPTQPPSGEDTGEEKGEDKGEDNGEDNANEVLWAGFTQNRMSLSVDMCLALLTDWNLFCFSFVHVLDTGGRMFYFSTKGVVFLLCVDLIGYNMPAL